jgi:UDP-2,4-diacetamido-2,4,6-trideoxy-beta-L-altropyranose hydrolase
MNVSSPSAQGLTVLVRTDSSEARGTGHFNRCLSLASALQDGGAAVTFACAEIDPAAERLVRDRRFSLTQLKPHPRVGDGAMEAVLSKEAQVADADFTAAAVGRRVFDWVIVDHYGLGAEWERRIRGICRWVVAIDDLANRPHDCNVLVDQNLRVDEGAAYDDLLRPGSERLLGPRYALLDASFSAARDGLHEGGRDGVLVAFGGSDPLAMTAPVLRALIEVSGGKLQIDVAVGALLRDAAEIEALSARTPGVRFHHATRDMAGLMARARLYIGAGGTTNWERCCLALPGVVVSIAPNQVAACRALDDAGSHVYLGDAKGISPETIAATAMSLLASPAWWTRLAERSSSLVDGLGARRVAARLAIGEIHLREASTQDGEKILTWRNHPAVRKHSGDGKEIDRAEHAHWLARVLADPDCYLLIGADARGECGVLRYDVKRNTAEVSIYLAPDRLGTGVGLALLAAGERWLAVYRPEVAAISADVQKGNQASARLFLGAGYLASRTTYLKHLTGNPLQ